MTYTSGKSSHLRVSNLKRTQYEINAHAHTHTHTHKRYNNKLCQKNFYLYQSDEAG